VLLPAGRARPLLALAADAAQPVDPAPLRGKAPAADVAEPPAAMFFVRIVTPRISPVSPESN
jgi:hypothetical protein